MAEDLLESCWLNLGVKNSSLVSGLKMDGEVAPFY